MGKKNTFPSYPKVMHYFTMYLLCSFLQLIHKPTRNNNIIDLLFNN